jgi:hypothetical protein
MNNNDNYDKNKNENNFLNDNLFEDKKFGNKDFRDKDENHFDLDKIEYPEIELETEKIGIVLNLKRDYSKIDDFEKRKLEFKKDIQDFLKNFIKHMNLMI